MAERPVFIPLQGTRQLVRELYFPLQWNPGFAPVQKRKNVAALHEAASKGGVTPLLEISSKSEEKVGQHLSAFHLKVREADLGEIRLEAAFQGSKVFERGGPYNDLYALQGREAKRDRAIYPHRTWLERVHKYAGFTDIEFNPTKSVNCQARSFALFVSLLKNDLIDRAITSPQMFTTLISEYDYHPMLRDADAQKSLRWAAS
jgi:hypothetical protein